MKLLKQLKPNRLDQALSLATFKTQEQRDGDILFLASLKPRKTSERPPQDEATKMLKAQQARRKRLLKKGLEKSKPFSPSLEKPIKIIENPEASHKYAGFRLGKKNARKILIGCPTEGKIDKKGRLVEHLSESNNYYNEIMHNGGDGILDHSSIADSLAYLDPAALYELQELAERLGIDFDAL